VIIMTEMKTILWIRSYFLEDKQYRRFGEFYNTVHDLATSETRLDMIRQGTLRPSMIILDSETYDPDFVRTVRQLNNDIVICLYATDEESREDQRYDIDCLVPRNMTNGDALAAFIRSRIGE